MAAVKARFGRLDALVNVAGGFLWEKIEGGDPQQLGEMFAVNLTTTVNAPRRRCPISLKAGRDGSSTSARWRR